jgi:hypothetical protein
MMLGKAAVALAIALLFLGVVATIGSLSNLKSEFVGARRVQAETSKGASDESDRPLDRGAITVDEEMRDERC